MKRKVLKLFILIIIIIIIALILLVVLSNKVMPLYMSYAKEEMKRVVTTREFISFESLNLCKPL